MKISFTNFRVNSVMSFNEVANWVGRIVLRDKTFAPA